MERNIHNAIVSIILILVGFQSVLAEDAVPSTDSLYREIIRTVQEADFTAMAGAYHPDAVLVTSKSSTPISEVILRWKSDGEKFQKEGGVAFVTFRFSSRLSSATTAFDSGIFRYGTRDKDGVENVSYMHFEDLSVLKNGRWLTIMERQMSSATVEEWESLPEWK
jgi:hypothetical protein